MKISLSLMSGMYLASMPYPVKADQPLALRGRGDHGPGKMLVPFGDKRELVGVFDQCEASITGLPNGVCFDAIEEIADQFASGAASFTEGNKVVNSVVTDVFLPLLDMIQVPGLLFGSVTNGLSFCVGEFTLTEIKSENQFSTESICKDLPLKDDVEWGMFSFNIPVLPGACVASPQILRGCMAYTLCESTGLPSIAWAIDGATLACVANLASGGSLAPVTALVEKGVAFVSSGFSLHNMFAIEANVYNGGSEIHTIETNPSYYSSMRLQLDASSIVGDVVPKEIKDLLKLTATGTAGITLNIENEGKLVPAGPDAFDAIDDIFNNGVDTIYTALTEVFTVQMTVQAKSEIQIALPKDLGKVFPKVRLEVGSSDLVLTSGTMEVEDST
eukprot:scaffold25422_cov187-Amphora_coffeaeformis.AAC.1